VTEYTEGVEYWDIVKNHWEPGQSNFMYRMSEARVALTSFTACVISRRQGEADNGVTVITWHYM